MMSTDLIPALPPGRELTKTLTDMTDEQLGFTYEASGMINSYAKPELQLRLKAYVAEGLSANKIGERFKRNRSTITRWGGEVGVSFETAASRKQADLARQEALQPATPANAPSSLTPVPEPSSDGPTPWQEAEVIEGTVVDEDEDEDLLRRARAAHRSPEFSDPRPAYISAPKPYRPSTAPKPEPASPAMDHAKLALGALNALRKQLDTGEIAIDAAKTERVFAQIRLRLTEIEALI
jgi:hypothetical protein